MLLRSARQVPGVPAGEARTSITINEADRLSSFFKNSDQPGSHCFLIVAISLPKLKIVFTFFQIPYATFAFEQIQKPYVFSQYLLIHADLLNGQTPGPAFFAGLFFFIYPVGFGVLYFEKIIFPVRFRSKGRKYVPPLIDI
ncbi:MAG: hypothetical protein P1P82_11515 [Bacteroidales bacterium]|nr:hypothetical protein [Bacteroidales bacterium]